MRSFVLLLAVVMQNPYLYAQEDGARIPAESKKEAASPPTSIQVSSEPIPKYGQPPNTDAEEERAIRDLKAQEEMAVWARRTFYGSLAGIFVSTIGLIAIVYSLRLNDDATRAAQAAVKIAETSNEIQSRAWISATCCLTNVHHAKTHLGVDGTYANVICQIKNHGNSPAVLVRFNAESILLPKASPETELADFAAKHQAVSNEALFSLFPGDTTELSHYIFFSTEMVGNKKDKNNWIHPSVVGVVTYKTANSTQTRQTGIFYLIVSPGENGSAMVVIPSDTLHLPTTITLAGPPIITAS